MRENIITQIVDKYYEILGMEELCKNCRYTCCKGGIWLLPNDVEDIKKSIDILGVLFIDNFTKVNEKDKVRLLNNKNCPYLNEEGKCGCYDRRPFICRIIPVDIEYIDDNFYWVLRKYCPLYANSQIKLEYLIKNLKKMTTEINNQIDLEFMNCLKKIHSISKYYGKSDDIIIINKVILSKGGMVQCE